MMKVRSILGDINASVLNHCQCHEHLFIAKGQSEKVNPVLLIDDYDKTLLEVQKYRSNGGKSIVDCQPLGCGRMAENLIKISKEANVNIICSTGFHKLIFYYDDHWIHNIESEKLAKLMIDEIEEGIYIDGDFEYPKKQIKNKAGIIKIAADKQGINKKYKKYFEAATIAALKTGAPIQCHIEDAKTADDIISFFRINKIKPEQIILAHMDRSINNKPQALSALKKGVFLECDTIGRYKYHGDEEEINFLKDLCDQGYNKQILIGLDTTRARLKSYGGEVGLSFILEEFLNKLMKKGFKNKIIEDITINNPQKALSLKL